jgi:glutathione peroxidase
MNRPFMCVAAALALVVPAAVQGQDKVSAKIPAVLKFKVKNIEGKDVDLAKYAGKIVLIVNVASECGYTPQYKGLQALHEKHGKDGLAILAFPSNDFGKQEPGTEAQIKEFCSKEYGVKFDLFAKVGITGKDAAPLFQHLTSEKTNPNHAGPVRWNFEKFLIGRDGTVIARFASDVDPESDEMQDAIRKALQK